MNTIQDGWEVYETVAKESGAETGQLALEYRAFYSGCSWVLALINEVMLAVDDKRLSDEAGCQILASLHDECDMASLMSLPFSLTPKETPKSGMN